MNKNSLNKDDPQVRAVAIAIATEDSHMLPDSVVKYGKDLLESESVSYKELSQHFQHQGISTDMIRSGVDMLVDNGIIDKYEFGSIDRIRFTPAMIELINEVKPNDTKEIGMKTDQNKQDAGAQGSLQKASGSTGEKNQEKPNRSRFDQQVEKISNKENLELAKNVVGTQANPMDEEVNLVKAIFDDNAEGVNFDTISNKFDVRGERASLFMALSKELSTRGVIDKIPGTNGDLYVVTMPFRQLMENAKRNDPGRYETGGTDVAHSRTQGTQDLVSGGPQTRDGQDRRDEGGTNERRSGGAADQYRSETGRDLSQDTLDSRGQSDSQRGSTVETPMSVRDQQRSGNVGSGGQGRTGSSGEGTDRGHEESSNNRLEDITNIGGDFQPDPAVLSVNIAVFGTSMTVDDVRNVTQAARDFLTYADRNPAVKPSFETHGVVFSTERAEAFLRNATYYGLGD